jgi:uncharacterized protein YlxW (UPF0749 family)
MAWRTLVPLTALLAGVLFATSHETAKGTDLRAGRFSQLTDLITTTQHEVADQEREAAALRRDVASLSQAAAAGSSVVAKERARAEALAGPAGLLAVRGPGVTVSLDDAPRPAGGEPPASDNPDDLVVHQQDVQSVLNALWAGGAEAVTVMGERLVATSAVRCVGNTLLVQGRLVGPPFVVRAIGDPSRMRSALAVEPGVALFRQYVRAFRLGYSVTDQQELRMPAYDGPLDLPNAKAAA